MASVWLQPLAHGLVARARVATPADVAAIEQVAVHDLLPAWTILGALEISAGASPRKPALIALDRADPTRVAVRIGYAELASRVRALANRLRDASQGSQPVISILAPLVPEALIAAWAGATAGVANPINPFLRTDHVAAIMNAAGTTVLLCDGDARAQALELRARVPSLRAVWVTDPGTPESLEAQSSAAVGDRLQFQPAGAAETAALFHTGGTTAAPKLVRHTQAGQLLNAWCCGAWSNSRADGVIAIGMPHFHVGGAICCALRSLVFGQTLVLVGPEGYRSPRVLERYWDAVEEHGVTNTISTPTTAAALVANWNGRRAPPGYAHSAGGSGVPRRVAQEFAERFGMPLHEIWGMTELQGALIGNPEAAEPRPGSIGIPFPFHRLRCIAVDGGDADRPLAANTTGLLSVHGPCVTPGYLDPERSRELFLKSAANERWLDTGDLARIDEAGAVWLQGRVKDLIIRGGHNIDPLVIEAALTAHPAVLHAAAVGEPDPEKGELPVAYVQLRPGSCASEQELLLYCQQHIAERAAIPRSVRIIDLMPLTAVGKIFKPQLRADATARRLRELIAQFAGCESVETEIRDSGAGLCVVLKCSDSKQAARLAQIRAALERYTFRVLTESTDGGA